MVTDRPTLAQLYGSRTMLVLLALGFSGGIPNLLATSIAPAWTTKTDWSVEAIGLLSLLQLPYALKFLWAPAVDRVKLPLISQFGRRRSWILASQVGVLALVIVIAAWGPGTWMSTDDETSASSVSLLAWLISIPLHAWIFMALLAVMVALSATQDIVSDAYRVEVLAKDQLGAGAGVFVSGYRLAYVVLGAAVVASVGFLGWDLAVGSLAVLAFAGIFATVRAREPQHRGVSAQGLYDAVIAPFSTLSRQWRWRFIALILFVLVFRLPDQLANAMTSPLLLKGLAYTLAQLGWVRQGFGFTMTIVGALAGGWMVARFGLMRCLLVFGALQAISNGGFLLLAHFFHATTANAPETPAPVLALLPVIAVENFSGGLIAAGFVAFLMSVCDPRYVATQYALLTALMALSGAIGGALSGVLTKELDYPMFFLFTILAGIPGIALIAFVRPPRSVVASPRQ